jgi:hypothetical protein
LSAHKLLQKSHAQKAQSHHGTATLLFSLAAALSPLENDCVFVQALNFKINFAST